MTKEAQKYQTADAMEAPEDVDAENVYNQNGDTLYPSDGEDF